MAVLLVTQDFPPDRGGIQTYCRELVDHLAAAGEQVRVWCPAPERASGPVAGPRSIAVDRIGVHGSWLFAPVVLRVERYLAAHPDVTDIIYAQWQVALWQLVFPRLARRFRRVCLVHGRELLDTVFGPLTRPLARRVLAGMDELLPVSSRVQSLLDDLLPRARPAIRRVPPGVDPSRFRPLPADPLRARLGLAAAPVILSISRLAPRKNIDGVIRAFASIAAEHRDAVLVIGGAGPERAPLEALARELGLARAVRFVGRVSDDELVAYYNLASVFVLASRDRPGDVEGFGITLLEAGACEIPVIAGRAGGMPDAVVDGHTGLLVDPDDHRAIARAIARLLGDPEGARRIGRAARARIVRDFTWARCAERVREGFAAARGNAA